MEQVRAVLLPEQWAKVPESIKRLRGGLRGPGQERPGGQRPPG